MNEKDPINSLNEIKAMMQKSSKFTSISGYSGIWAGVVGIISAAIAHFVLLDNSSDYGQYQEFYNVSTLKWKLILLGIVTVIVAAVGGFYFIVKKSSNDNIKFINPVTKRILKRFSFVLVIRRNCLFDFYQEFRSFIFCTIYSTFLRLSTFHSRT